MRAGNTSALAKPGSRLRELGPGCPGATIAFGSLRRGVSGWNAALLKRRIAAG